MQSSQQTPPVNDIRSQLRTFINLLQTSNPSQYKSIKSPGRLSVILSASQPQSSSMDKSSANQSAPRSIKNSQFDTTQRPLIEQIFKQLLATSLTKNQEKLLNQLSCCIDQILKKSTMLQESIFAMEDQLSKEKKGTDELLEALIKMDEEQKQIWNTYYQLSDQFKAKSTEFDILKTQNSQLKQHIDTYKKELKFVKNLVYVANQNYQQLQGQYHKIVQKSTLSSKNLKPVLVLRQKRSQQNLLTQRSDLSKSSNRNMCSPYEQQQKSRRISTDQHQLQSSYSPVRKSSKSLKSRRSISPLMKDKQNIECNFKDVYRKMIMKNLKSKKRKTQQSNDGTKDLYA